MDERLKDLSLMLLYLTGWEEESRNDPGQKILRSWKGYPFDILNDLTERKFITQHRKSKSVVFTDAGKKKAEEVRGKYL